MPATRLRQVRGTPCKSGCLPRTCDSLVAGIGGGRDAQEGGGAGTCRFNNSRCNGLVKIIGGALAKLLCYRDHYLAFF